MTYEIYVVVPALNEKFVFTFGQSKKYVPIKSYQNFLQSTMASFGLKLSLYDGVSSYAPLKDASKMGSLVS